jgi:RHS repeat-associated protein
MLTRTRYEPYGGRAAGTNPARVGFTGHVNDPDIGLVYMQQRYYEPIAGRFLSVDPVTTDAKTGDSFNRYAYGNNNPYKYTDPDGRDPRLVAFAVITLGQGQISAAGSAYAAPTGEKVAAFATGFGLGLASGAVTAMTALSGATVVGSGFKMAVESTGGGKAALAVGAAAQVASQGLTAAVTAADATSTVGAPGPAQPPQGSNSERAGSQNGSSSSKQERAQPKSEEKKVEK